MATRKGTEHQVYRFDPEAKAVHAQVFDARHQGEPVTLRSMVETASGIFALGQATRKQGRTGVIIAFKVGQNGMISSEGTPLIHTGTDEFYDLEIGPVLDMQEWRGGRSGFALSASGAHVAFITPTSVPKRKQETLYRISLFDANLHREWETTFTSHPEQRHFTPADLAVNDLGEVYVLRTQVGHGKSAYTYSHRCSLSKFQGGAMHWEHPINTLGSGAISAGDFEGVRVIGLKNNLVPNNTQFQDSWQGKCTERVLRSMHFSAQGKVLLDSQSLTASSDLWYERADCLVLQLRMAEFLPDRQAWMLVLEDNGTREHMEVEEDLFHSRPVWAQGMNGAGFNPYSRDLHWCLVSASDAAIVAHSMQVKEGFAEDGVQVRTQVVFGAKGVQLFYAESTVFADKAPDAQWVSWGLDGEKRVRKVVFSKRKSAWLTGLCCVLEQGVLVVQEEQGKVLFGWVE